MGLTELEVMLQGRVRLVRILRNPALTKHGLYHHRRHQ